MTTPGTAKISVVTFEKGQGGMTMMTLAAHPMEVSGEVHGNFLVYEDDCYYAKGRWAIASVLAKRRLCSNLDYAEAVAVVKQIESIHAAIVFAPLNQLRHTSPLADEIAAIVASVIKESRQCLVLRKPMVKLGKGKASPLAWSV